MALYMLSTDIAVCLIRGTSRALDERVASALPEELCISAVTRGELLLGVSRQDELATGRKTHAIASPIDPAKVESWRKITHTALANLTPGAARALRRRFGIDSDTNPTLEEVSKRFDRTRERIRAVEQQAVEFAERAHDLPRVVDRFLARVACLPWDSNAATQFATLAVDVHRSGAPPAGGTPLGTTDSMVAGHAIAVGAVLVVSNESRFSHVASLKTENWLRPVRNRPRQ